MHRRLDRFPDSIGESRTGVDAEKRNRSGHPIIPSACPSVSSWQRTTCWSGRACANCLRPSRTSTSWQSAKAAMTCWTPSTGNDRTPSSPLFQCHPAPLPRVSAVLRAGAEGKSNAASARQLFLAESSVEKHINSIFSKLGLSEEPEIHRRVRATLLFLADRRAPEQA